MVVAVCVRSTRSRITTRFFSSETTEYIEKWHASVVKSKSFYEHHSTDKPKKYFYSIDLQGRVFLEETLPKNIATSLKNQAFLEFFFKHLTPSKERDLKLLPPEVRQDYPFVSHCGIERNFVRPADVAIVFDALEYDAHDESLKLHYGGSLHQPFDPSCLAISQRSGRLYHELLRVGEKEGTPLHQQSGNFGLVKSSLAVALSDQIEIEDESHGTGMEFVTQGTRIRIPFLPEDAEAGVSSMPVDA